MTSQINALDTNAYQNIQTAFSAQTSANQIQDIIDLKLDKRRKVLRSTALRSLHCFCRAQISRYVTLCTVFNAGGQLDV